MIGKTVTVTIDRPLGSTHPKHKDMIYEVNYGYVKGVMAPDNQEQDCYVLGVEVAVKSFTGKVIAIIEREDDCEDKWIVSNRDFTNEEIMSKVHFVEKYFKSTIRR